MKKILTSGLVFTLVLVFGMGSVLAADKKRDKKRDGTCTRLYTTDSAGLTLAADRKKTRKRDRTCQSTIKPADDDMLQLAARTKRDRKRDGTCRS
jgi:hypothetical protein